MSFGVQLTHDGFAITWKEKVIEGLETFAVEELATARAARLTQRWPGDTWELGRSASWRGGPYAYSWEEQWHEYLPDDIKPSGILAGDTIVHAKDYMRYRLDRRGVSQEKIRSLLTALDLEAI